MSVTFSYFNAKMIMNNNNHLKNFSGALNLWRILIVFILFINVSARLRQNNAELLVSCDDSAMDVQMTFKEPFSGIVFIPEHYYDPICSYGVSPNSSVLQITLKLPHDSCKMRISKVLNKRIGFNTIVVFHHRMLETVYDYIQNVTCELENPINDLNKNIWSEPQLNTWISFENPISILPEDIVDKMDLEDALLIVYHVKDRGMYRDMVVMNCIGHDDRIANQKTNFYRISNPFGCFQESDLVSNFTVFRNPSSNQKMMAYATIKNFSMVVRKRLYITCGAEICKDECKRTCRDQKIGFYFSDVVTKSLVHRPDGSVRPASLTAFERFDRQRRSQDDLELFLHYTANEQNELLFEKMNLISSYSVNQSDGVIKQINRNDTTPLPQDSEEQSHSEHAIKQFKIELFTEKTNSIPPYSVNQSDGVNKQLNQNGTAPLPQDSEEHSHSERAFKQLKTELFSEKINAILSYSVIQTDALTKQINQNGTTPLPLDSDEHSYSKRAFKQLKTELFSKKVNSISSYSVIQSDGEIKQTNKNSTSSLLEDSEEHSRYKRAIKQLKTELFTSRINVIVIKYDETSQQTAIKEESVLKKVPESSLSDFSDVSELASVVKKKISFEQQHSSRIDVDQKSDRFNFNSFLRALIAIFALICISGVCYFLFSFRRHLDVESVSDYAIQPYI